VLSEPKKWVDTGHARLSKDLLFLVIHLDNGDLISLKVAEVFDLAIGRLDEIVCTKLTR
jgi:hypothetical protein